MWCPQLTDAWWCMYINWDGRLIFGLWYTLHSHFSWWVTIESNVIQWITMKVDHRHDFRPGPWRKSLRNNRVYRLQVACGLLGSAIPIDKAQTFFFWEGLKLPTRKDQLICTIKKARRMDTWICLKIGHVLIFNCVRFWRLEYSYVRASTLSSRAPAGRATNKNNFKQINKNPWRTRIYIYTHTYEGSLEVKLPTIWTNEKQRREE